MLRLARCVQRCPTRFTLGTTRYVSRLSRDVSKEDKHPYYITTPIFYPNADPHIGHLYSLVAADVCARFSQMKMPARSVKFLAGTDEHGLKIQKAAQAKDVPPSQFCDMLSSRFRKLAEMANISNTVFMRTTLPEHHRTVESVWNTLKSKDLIYTATYSGWYSITDECFYTEQQILTDPVKGPISRETGSAVEKHTEVNYMFRLSGFTEALLEHYTRNQTIFPPQHNDYIVKTLTQQPLEDLSISRPRSRLSWGIPVPDDPEQTIYVWFDALLVYLSGIGYPWKSDNGLSAGWPVNLQVIGKDILRFHAFYLPAILLALGQPLQENLLVHAHWTVDQQKMSKSVGNVADPFDAMKEFGVDVIRFYLCRVGGRFRDDTDWSHVQLKKHHHEIKSQLGNLFTRITSPKIRGRVVDHPPLDLSELCKFYSISNPESPIFALLEAIRSMPPKVHEAMDQLELGDALEAVMELLRVANKAITEVAPWSDKTQGADVYGCCVASLEALRVAGICLQPFMPDVAGRLLDALGVSLADRTWAAMDDDVLGRRWAKAVPFGAIEGVRLI